MSVKTGNFLKWKKIKLFTVGWDDPWLAGQLRPGVGTQPGLEVLQGCSCLRLFRKPAPFPDRSWEEEMMVYVLLGPHLPQVPTSSGSFVPICIMVLFYGFMAIRWLVAWSRLVDCFLGHRSRRLQWPIVITRCPSSVCPSVYLSVVRRPLDNLHFQLRSRQFDPAITESTIYLCSALL